MQSIEGLLADGNYLMAEKRSRLLADLALEASSYFQKCVSVSVELYLWS